MSLKRCAATLGIAWFFASTTASASPPPETSAALLAGYGLQADTVLDGRTVNAYGPAIGARWGTTLSGRFYVGATFVAHTGTLERARDVTSTSTYRASYHRSYFGPELGLDVHVGRLLLRPWLGSGLLVAIDRTSVRRFERNDDALLFYVSPGILGGIETGRWLVGLDVRAPAVPAEAPNKWAPALFFVIAPTM